MAKSVEENSNITVKIDAPHSVFNAQITITGAHLGMAVVTHCTMALLGVLQLGQPDGELHQHDTICYVTFSTTAAVARWNGPSSRMHARQLASRSANLRPSLNKESQRLLLWDTDVYMLLFEYHNAAKSLTKAGASKTSYPQHRLLDGWSYRMDGTVGSIRNRNTVPHQLSTYHKLNYDWKFIN